MNIGYIYKITNLINNKIYIGQTSKTISRRWTQHISDSKRKSKDCALYRAFNKYGIDNFQIEKIEECKTEELDEKEVYWISFYNSFYKGYNETLGGAGRKVLSLDESVVIKDYEHEKSLIKVAAKNNCSTETIAEILKKHNIYISSAAENAINKGFKILQLDKEKNIINEFKTLREAGRYCAEHYPKVISKNAHIAIRSAILSNGTAFGFYWCSNKYSEKNKEKFLKAKKKYMKSCKNQNMKTKHCPNCGKLILNNSNFCKDCANQQRKEKYIQKCKDTGITREILKEKIRTSSFTQIGKELGVSDNTIRKKCKLFGLPTKSTEIKKYTDEEWEKI